MKLLLRVMIGAMFGLGVFAAASCAHQRDVAIIFRPPPPPPPPDAGPDPDSE